jgi:hypothetical protein
MTTAGESGKRCPLHRDPDRKNIFQEKGGFWWSDELGCWMISQPAAIAEILKSQNFSVHSYKFDEIAARIGIDLPHHKALRCYLPVTLEGESHTALRRRFSAEISANTARAVEIFESELIVAIRRHLDAEPPSRFCAVKEILAPPIRSANLVIARLEGCKVSNLESLPCFFDRSTSLRKRQQIERLIGDIQSGLSDTIGDDEKYFRIAMLALNMNTLLGSISESFLTVIRRNSGVALSAMDWDRDVPATALPMIERKALADWIVSDHSVKAGDRVQLFLDVDNFDRDRGPRHAGIYFAPGPHSCLGMNYSRKVWDIIVQRMRRIDRKIHVHDIRYRSNDRLFNILDNLEIETYV